MGLPTVGTLTWCFNRRLLDAVTGSLSRYFAQLSEGGRGGGGGGGCVKVASNQS